MSVVVGRSIPIYTLISMNQCSEKLELISDEDAGCRLNLSFPRGSHAI